MGTGLIDSIDGFAIRKLIARSGCSTVYLASPEDTNQVLVIKVSHSEDKQGGKNGYKGKNVYADLIHREVDVLRGIHHPGIVHIFPLPAKKNKKVTYKSRAMNLPDQPWYFTMEYLAGGSLKENMRHIKDFPLSWKLELFYQILIVVDYMHQLGWAHCDLKPENIFFRLEPHKDEIPMPVLIDMGTVSASSELDTELAASPNYAAPEALRVIYGKVPIAQVEIIPALLDVWSLGTIFFELVTGEMLIKSKHMERIVSSVLNHTIPTISGTHPELPSNLDILLNVMLEEDPNDRPPVSDLIEALENRVAPPPRISYRRTGLFGR